MKKVLFTAFFLGLLLGVLSAVPGQVLRYLGDAPMDNSYTSYRVQGPNEDLRFYKAVVNANRIDIQSFTVNLAGYASLPSVVYSYEHPSAFAESGGAPVLLLNKKYNDRLYFVFKNDIFILSIVLYDDHSGYNVLALNSIAILPNTLLNVKKYCFIDSYRLLISNTGSIYMLDLANAEFSTWQSFSNVSGTSLNIYPFAGTYAVISYISSATNYGVGHLLNFQTMNLSPMTFMDDAVVPISGDFGNNTFLGTQTDEDFDGRMLVRTLLFRLNPNNSISYHALYYGGSLNFFDYTPMHTFKDVTHLGDGRFLAICSDYQNIPGNERLSVFTVIGNGVFYDAGFAELSEMVLIQKVFKLQGDYYLSYQHTAIDGGIKLIDMNQQRLSSPDINMLNPRTVVPTSQDAFYILNSSNRVYVYQLVNPSINDDNESTPVAQTSIQIAPNPFTENTKIHIQSKDNNALAAAIYDIRGRKIKSFELSQSNSGKHLLEWDGRDNAGKPCSKGIYLLKTTNGGYSKTAKLMMVD